MQNKVKKRISKKKPVTKKPVAKKLEKEKFKFALSDKILSSGIKALQELDRRQKGASKDLFASTRESMMYLTLLVNSLPKEINIKPFRMELPSGLYSGTQKKFCMIVSDQFRARFKDDLKHPSLANWKFINYDKLRRNFKTFAEKKALYDSYELFFCEGRVYMLIKKMLGKQFYQRNKYPYPIEFNSCLVSDNGTPVPEVGVLSGKGEVRHLQSFEEFSLDIPKLKTVLDTLSLKSTYFYQGNGPEYALKVCRLSEDMNMKGALRNIRSGVKHLLKYLVGQGLKLTHVRRISLKLAQSEAFPIYSYLTPAEKKVMRKVMSEQQN
jgi:hypothetical protein